jgi:hypothetical protein
LLISWGIKHRQTGFIVLGGLMSAFAAQVKFQGLEYWFLGVIILCRFIFTKEFFNFRFVVKALAGVIVPFALVEMNFAFFKVHYSLTEIYNQPYFIFYLHGLWSRMSTLFFILFDDLFLSGNWNVLWFFLSVAALVDRKNKKPYMVRFLGFVLLVFVLDYLKYGLFPRTFSYMLHGTDNVTRFLLHFYPLCPVLIGLLVYDFLKNRSSQVAPRPLDLL